MIPRILAQAPSTSPYATQLVVRQVDYPWDAAGAAFAAAEVMALPAGRRALLLQNVHRLPLVPGNTALILGAFAAHDAAPDLLVIDSEGDNVGDPASPLRVAIDAAMSPLRAAWPKTRTAAYLITAMTADDAKHVPDINGWPVPSALGSFTDASPEAAGWANNLLNFATPMLGNEVVGSQFNAAWSMMRLELNRIRAAVRAGATKITPWCCPPAGTILNAAYWLEMVWHLLLTAGPEVLWYNGDHQDDTILTAACAALMAHADRGDWVKAVGASTLMSYANDWVGSTALLSDGSLVTRCTAKPGARPTTLSIAGRAVPVAVEDTAGCWRVGRAA